MTVNKLACNICLNEFEVYHSLDGADAWCRCGLHEDFLLPIPPFELNLSYTGSNICCNITGVYEETYWESGI